ncbi:MAG: hypothetical protein ABJN36_14180 [Cyclobacteriaceae bacterium]
MRKTTTVNREISPVTRKITSDQRKTSGSRKEITTGNKEISGGTREITAGCCKISTDRLPPLVRACSSDLIQEILTLRFTSLRMTKKVNDSLRWLLRMTQNLEDYA